MGLVVICGKWWFNKADFLKETFCWSEIVDSS